MAKLKEQFLIFYSFDFELKKNLDTSLLYIFEIIRNS